MATLVATLVAALVAALVVALVVAPVVAPVAPVVRRQGSYSLLETVLRRSFSPEMRARSS